MVKGGEGKREREGGWRVEGEGERRRMEGDRRGREMMRMEGRRVKGMGEKVRRERRDKEGWREGERGGGRKGWIERGGWRGKEGREKAHILSQNSIHTQHRYTGWIPQSRLM